MNMKQLSADLTVIGGGPAGYVTAIRAAQKGLKVCLVEKKKTFGGTCLNIGCIPTKVLAYAAEIYKTLSSGIHGISYEALSYDWGKINDKRRKIVDKLSNEVEKLLQREGIQLINGEAEFISTNQLGVRSESEEYRIRSVKTVIATGSETVNLPIPGGDNGLILDSTKALELTELPKSMAIIGGGVIGTEFACIFTSFGTQITIIEMMPQILSGLDTEIASFLHNRMVESGIEIKTNMAVKEIVPCENGAKLKLISTKNNAEEELLVNSVLQSVGRRSNIDGLGLDKIGVSVNKGSVVIDEFFQTNINNIYAIGDVTGAPMLAHKAFAQGRALVNNITGRGIKETVDNISIPSCIYTIPEVASVGLTEEQARQQGYKPRIGRFPLYANGKAIIESGSGFIKTILNDEDDVLLGMHMVGPKASEIISQGAIAISVQMTSDELEKILFPHPSISEAFGESIYAAIGFPVHIPRVK